MCALSSSSRGAMLRRRRDPTNAIRGLFSFEFRRDLSAASVSHVHRRNVGRQERFLNWLKAIFNKSAEDNSYKTDATNIDRTATTRLDHPKIATAKRPADSSSKVDVVVNQKLANFDAAQLMTKFEDGNLHIEKHNARGDGRANAIQQLAIYASLQSTRVETRKTSWLDSGNIHRSERNNDVIEFVAKENLNVAAHYRCYTSPRHCYRLPPQTKQPLLGSCALNRSISVPTRAIVGFASRYSKSSIRETNMPEKREKKDEKKDRKEKKKPIIRTDSESVDSSENRTEMVADDNPKGDPDAAAFRYEWGVKLAEESAAEASDNDNFGSEKGRRYVTKRLWGVNLKHSKPDVEDAASPTSESPGRGAKEHRNASPISKGSDIFDETKKESVSTPNVLEKEPDMSNLKAQEEKIDADLPMSSEALRKIMRTSPNMLKEIIIIDNEYNIPEGNVNADTEISAWKNLVIRSKTIHEEDFLPTDNVENLEMLSIRPEAPQPKLDVRVVKSTKDDLKDKKVDQLHFEYKPAELKRSGSSYKSDGYLSKKKLHTASMQIRYVHLRTNNTRQYVGPLPINLVLIDKTAQIKFTSTFSTNLEDSMRKKVNNEASNQRTKQQTDAKSHNEERFDDLNNALKEEEAPSSVKSQRSSSKNQAQAADAVDKEMEISANQSQNVDQEKIHPSNSIAFSEFTRKDESHFKDVHDEIESYENSYANYTKSQDKDDSTYVDLDTSSTRSSTKLNTIKSIEKDSTSEAKSDEEITSDSNVEDVDDDSSKEYIVDGDYVRIPGDPYPYNKENLKKWRVPRSRRLVYKPIKRETFLSSVARSIPRNVNDAYANAVGEPRDSHAGAVMETSGSDDGASARNARRASGFHVSPRNQRVVFDCLRDDAAEALGSLRSTKAVSLRFDVGANVSEKMNEAARSDDKRVVSLVL